MSRFCSWENIDSILSAADGWKEKCLLGDGSLFSDQNLWIPEYFQELEKHFVNNPDERTDLNFIEKLKIQLSNVSNPAKQLAAECLWILFLFTRVNMGPDAKRSVIKQVWEWSGSSLDMNNSLLANDTLEGIGKSGTAFNTLRPFELMFCIELCIDFKQLKDKAQLSVLSDPWKFGEWLEEIENHEKRQFRHMITFFLFPDYYESCCSKGDKQSILSVLDDRSLRDVRRMSWLEIDKALYDLRSRLAAESGNNDFTFYDEPYRSRWSDGGPKAKRVKEQEAKYVVLDDDSAYADHPVPQNLILYGPPGTGKTYNSINHAVAISKGVPVAEVIARDKADHKAVKAEYDALVESGQIVFTTFHQSMGYEDFVEGIKPQENEDGGIHYEVVDGIFKKICDQASVKSLVEENATSIDLNGRRYWKMSLGNTSKPEDEDVYVECIENNYVLLGYGWDIDYSDCKNVDQIFELQKARGISSDKGEYEVAAVNTFIHKISVGDLVIISEGNRKFRAIGEITGNYERLGDADREHFRQKRAVKWLRVYEPSLPSSSLFRRNITQMTIYELRYALDLEKLEVLLSPQSGEADRNISKPYVLIIDEINRGNVSAILGELITLLEPDKRLGMENALRVTLPYSQDSDFGVPPNLHIIGTMNTADRSVEALDTALRRRFVFEEVMPNPELLSSVGEVDLIKMLSAINQRLEVLVGRDHTIGHSFFMQVESLADLKQVFHAKVIPQLQEYFYGDWEKINWVLGSGFIKRKDQIRPITWPADADLQDDLEERQLWELTRSSDWGADTFKSIYTNMPMVDNETA